MRTSHLTSPLSSSTSSSSSSSSYHHHRISFPSLGVALLLLPIVATMAADAATTFATRRIEASFLLPPTVRPPGVLIRVRSTSSYVRRVGMTRDRPSSGGMMSSQSVTSLFASTSSSSSSIIDHDHHDDDYDSNGRSSSMSDASVIETTMGDKGGKSRRSSRRRRRRVAILLCPAQFCVPADYADLLDEIRTRVETITTSTTTTTSDDNDDNDDIDDNDAGMRMEIVASRVAPLPRTEWIKVAMQLPTMDFLRANLNARTTLRWYFDAMEVALMELFAEAAGMDVYDDDDDDDDLEICIIGHSIGGWIARAYLGGLSASSTSVHRLARARVTSFITLGTPHACPDTALFDQTRGLLREVTCHPGCSSLSLSMNGNVDITCVCGSGVRGRVLTTRFEEFLAATSYLPLIGRIGDDVVGDGIVPMELSCMDAPARNVEIRECSITGDAVRHAHVLPTPWNLIDGNAPSWKLPEDILWYGSPGVLGQWLKYI